MAHSRLLLSAILAISGILPLAARAAHTHQGLWWASPPGSESGWGLNITHQGNTLFATWFTYDVDGSPMWLVMSSGMREMEYGGDGGYGYGMMMYYTNNYSGPLYRTTGPALNAATFDPRAVGVTEVGMARLNFDDPNNATFNYTVNGVTQTKTITKQVYATPVPECDNARPMSGANYQDLWWRSPAGSESGWGVNITHQGNTLFATWFTYGSDGKGMWYVMSEGARQPDGSFTGALYRTRGPSFSASPWSPAAVTVTRAGTGTFTFTDAMNGTFAYTVDGVSQSKAITRQVYSSPVSACQFP